MSKDLVKYHNDLNQLNMANLKEKELELFYAICLELKDKQNTEISININEFKKEFNISNKIDKKRFAGYIKSVHNKFLEIKTTIETDTIIKSSNFFNSFETNLDTGEMKIKVNKEYIYLLNNLTKMYTRFSFIAYQSLSSKYAKLLLPHLMQWDSTKEKYFEKEELFNILNIPSSYRNKIVNFNDKVLKPCLKELKQIFYNFKCEKKKINRNEIKGYLFTWEEKPKENITEEIEIITEIEVSKKMKNAIDFYINYEVFEILKDEYQVERMIEEFGEERSLKILEIIFKNNKNKKIESFEYFRKINSKIKTLKIKEDIKEEKEEITRQDIELEQTSLFITEITKEEYKKIYQEYLKNNNLEDNDISKKVFDISNKNKYKIIEKKVYTVDDIDPNLLLSKNGKKLFGGALQTRINKILAEMNQ